MKISVEDKKELLKAASFGYTAEQISEVMDLQIADIEAIISESEVSADE